MFSLNWQSLSMYLNEPTTWHLIHLSIFVFLLFSSCSENVEGHCDEETHNCRHHLPDLWPRQLSGLYLARRCTVPASLSCCCSYSHSSLFFSQVGLLCHQFSSRQTLCRNIVKSSWQDLPFPCGPSPLCPYVEPASHGFPVAPHFLLLGVWYDVCWYCCDNRSCRNIVPPRELPQEQRRSHRMAPVVMTQDKIAHGYDCSGHNGTSVN